MNRFYIILSTAALSGTLTPAEAADCSWGQATQECWVELSGKAVANDTFAEALRRAAEGTTTQLVPNTADATGGLILKFENLPAAGEFSGKFMRALAPENCPNPFSFAVPLDSGVAVPTVSTEEELLLKQILRDQTLEQVRVFSESAWQGMNPYRAPVALELQGMMSDIVPNFDGLDDEQRAKRLKDVFLGRTPWEMPAGPRDPEPAVPFPIGCPMPIPLPTFGLMGLGSGLGVLKAATTTTQDPTIDVDRWSLRYGCMRNPWLAECGALLPVIANWNETDAKLSELTPSNVAPELQIAAAAVRRDTVLIGVIGAGIVDSTGLAGALKEDVAQVLQCKKSAPDPHHCTGLLTPDGRSVVTAYHCVGTLLELIGVSSRADRQEKEGEIADLEIGQSAECRDTSVFRAVTGVAFSAGAGGFFPEQVHRCTTMTRTSIDTVEIHLKDTPGLPAERAAFVDTYGWGSATGLQHGRRVFGTGLSHVSVLKSKPAGFLAANRHCAKSYARMNDDGKFQPGQITSPDATGQNGFVCSTIDTYIGDSGGPVLAISDDGTKMSMIGVISHAYVTGTDVECPGAPKNEAPISDDTSGGEDRLNVLALLPQ